MRAGWNGKGMFLFLVPGSTFKVSRAPLLGIYPEGTEIKYHSHVDMKTAQGDVVPWLCSQTDMLAEDWQTLVEYVPVQPPPPDVNAVVADAERPAWHPLHVFGFAFYAVRRNAAHQVVAWISHEHAADPHVKVFACDGFSVQNETVNGTIDDAMKRGDELIAALEKRLPSKVLGSEPTFEASVVHIVNDAIEGDGLGR